MKACNKTHIEYVLPHTRFLLKWVPLVRKKTAEDYRKDFEECVTQESPENETDHCLLYNNLSITT